MTLGDYKVTLFWRVSKAVQCLGLAVTEKCCTFAGGEMAEWSNAAVLKTVDPGNRVRGFESLSLRTQLRRSTRTSGRGGRVVECGGLENR